MQAEWKKLGVKHNFPMQAKRQNLQTKTRHFPFNSLLKTILIRISYPRLGCSLGLALPNPHWESLTTLSQLYETWSKGLSNPIPRGTSNPSLRRSCGIEQIKGAFSITLVLTIDLEVPTIQHPVAI